MRGRKAALPRQIPKLFVRSLHTNTYSCMRTIIIQELVKSKTFCKASNEETEHEAQSSTKRNAATSNSKTTFRSLFLKSSHPHIRQRSRRT
jgi:hypothetical protein